MKTAEEFLENWLIENDIGPDNVEPAHVIIAMEHYAKEREREILDKLYAAYWKFL